MNITPINYFNQNLNSRWNNAYRIETDHINVIQIQKTLVNIANWFQKDPEGIFFVASRNFQTQYIIGPEIGHGSFGKVLNILNFPLFVLKIHSPGVIDQYHVNKNEAFNLNQIPQNSHIVKLIEHFDTDYPHQYAIILEKIFSPDLYTSFHKIQTKYSTPDILNIIFQLLESVKILHEKDIIHGDLKLNNLIFSQETNRLTVIDFGISVNKNHITNELLQTKQYRAPEIFLSAPYTENIDIWSIGCILFELYTGSILFPGFYTRDDTYEWNNHLQLLDKNFGTIPKDLLDAGKNTFIFYTQDQYGNHSFKKPVEIPQYDWRIAFAQIAELRNDPPYLRAQILSLFESMLQYTNRPSAAYLLDHHPLNKINIQFKIRYTSPLPSLPIKIYISSYSNFDFELDDSYFMIDPFDAEGENKCYHIVKLIEKSSTIIFIENDLIFEEKISIKNNSILEINFETKKINVVDPLTRESK